MFSVTSRRLLRVSLFGALAVALFTMVPRAQEPATTPAPSAPSAPPADRLGRSTPRGTLRGFLDAARAGDYELAAQYLNSRRTRADVLARELFVVLDARLTTRVVDISDAPEGSGANLKAPNQEVVGRIPGPAGTVDIVVERVQHTGLPPLWLFSARTLDAVPALHEAIVRSRHADVPDVLTRTRVAGIRLLDWLAIGFGLPVLYLAAVVLDRVLTPLVSMLRRRIFGGQATVPAKLPVPARILIVMVAGGWLMSALPFSLAARQLWSMLAGAVTIGAIVWLFVLLNGEVEQHVRRRIRPAQAAAGGSLVRLLRRCVDVLILFVGLVVILRYSGIDPTPALAGLGVGGIAVALAAQKTLENVIAGASLIFDQAVRVGDFLKMGDVSGTVDHIGLRSTRIRTLDRTVVSIPNGQIANASLETLSARDKFWFHPVVGLRYETSPDQLHLVIDGIRQLLADEPAVDPELTRVRFVRLGQFSLDIEIFAYVRARDWSHFLEIQEHLLFEITSVVHRAGAEIAFPSQTMYVANPAAAVPGRSALPL